MAYCYILYSEKLDRFYTGSTRHHVEVSLKEHLTELYGDKLFTAKAKDWNIYFFITCNTYEHALAIEKHIKKMKSKKYIENLKQYPEMVEKLKALYKKD